VPKGMFTELMEASDSQGRPRRQSRSATPPSVPAPSPDDRLPRELERMRVHSSHSYRFTEAELRWLRRFCLHASERLDRRISHNTLFRVLLRLADDEWSKNPEKNRLLDFLSRIQE